jgi:hypothetical protein
MATSLSPLLENIYELLQSPLVGETPTQIIQSLLRLLFTLSCDLIPPFPLLRANSLTIPCWSNEWSRSVWHLNFQILTMLCTHFSQTVMVNWPLFLSTSSSFDDELTAVTAFKLLMTPDPDATAKVGGGGAVITVPRSSQPSHSQPQESPLLRAALHASDVQFRVHAVTCLKVMLTSLPLQHWFRPRQRQLTCAELSTALFGSLLGKSINIEGCRQSAPRNQNASFLGNKVTSFL